MYPVSAYTFHIEAYNLQRHREMLNERLADLDTPICNMVIALDNAIREFENKLTVEFCDALSRSYGYEV